MSAAKTKHQIARQNYQQRALDEDKPNSNRMQKAEMALDLTYSSQTSEQYYKAGT